MKKVFTLLSLVLLMGTTVKAQKYYEVPGWPSQLIEELVPGEPFVMHPYMASDTLEYYYNGGQFYPMGYNLKTVNEKCVYTIEEAGEADGFPIYYLKNYNTGLYLCDRAYTDGSVLWDQRTTARAQRFYVQHPKSIYKAGGRRPAGWDYRSTCFYSSGRAEPNPNGYIFTLVDKPTNNNYLYFEGVFYYVGDAGAGVNFNDGQDYNLWYLYKPTQIFGKVNLQNVVDFYYKNHDGTFELNWIYPVPQSLKDEVKAEYEKAMQMLSDDTLPTAAYDEEAARIDALHTRYVEQGQRNYGAAYTMASVSGMVQAGYTFSDLPLARNTYEDLGLVTKAEQVWSEDEEENNPNSSLFHLVDGDTNTSAFFNDSQGKRTNKYYGVNVDLSSAYQDVTFKFTYRNEGMGPTRMHVYGSDNGSDWMTECYANFRGQYPGVNVNGETRADLMGITSVHLTRPYRYLRLECEATMWNNTDASGNYTWQLAELHFYNTPVDMENSLNRMVNPDTMAYMEEQIAATNQQLSALNVTAEQVEKLNDAYQRFYNNYPSKEKVLAVINRAQATHDASTEDTSSEQDMVGFCDPGSKAELQAVIDQVKEEVNATKAFTQERVTELIKKLEDALEVFNTKLHKPIDGHLYFIKSYCEKNTSGVRSQAVTLNHYIYAPDNDESQMLVGGYDPLTQQYDKNLDNRMNYYWRAIDLGNGKYKFQNVGTGTYMGSGFASATNATMSQDGEGMEIGLKSAGVNGAFNILFRNDVYAYAEGNYNSIITWHSANGSDNCAFIFEDASYSWKNGSWIDAVKPQFITFPYSIVGAYEGETLLFSGYNPTTQTLEFTAFDFTTSIEPGTPFLVVPVAQGSEEEIIGIELEPDYGSLDEIEYGFTGQNVNGMHGVITSVENNGYLVLDATGENLVVNPKKRVAANTAYFTDLYNAESVTQVSETGDYSIPVSEAVTGITNLTRNQKGAALYDLQGRRVSETSKGVYVRGTQKILVK